MSNYLTPKDTSLLLESGSVPCDNAALKIDKYIKKETGYKIDTRKESIRIGDMAKQILNIAVNEQMSVYCDFPASYRYGEIFKSTSRLIVGLGNASVTETSITMHHTYGVPFIPASAIKGGLRNFIVNEYFDNESAASADEDFKELFGKGGKNASMGMLIFFDSFPQADRLNISVDIMNPHYSDYYGGNRIALPTDDKSPIPVQFYTVPAGVKFTLRFLYIGKNFKDKQKNEPHLRGTSISSIFEDFLQYQGLGAKTSVGYGIFEKLG